MISSSQKAHDIAFAVFRVATLIRNHKLRRELEDAAIEFLNKFDNEVLHLGLPTVFDKLERFILLSKSIKEMKDVNADVLSREINRLRNSLQDNPAKTSGNRDEINLENDFSGSADDAIMSQLPLAVQTSDSEPKGELTSRQERILGNIRNTQFCRLRDLMAALPDVSERTIRNDIQVLIGRSLIKRVGNGGPSSYFESLEVALPRQILPA